MHHEPDSLEEALRRQSGAGSLRPPEQFFRSVRARRRRVQMKRAAAAMMVVLAFGSSFWMVSSPQMWTQTAPIQIVTVSKRPSALRRLRELPPEISAGPGLIEMSRVLDARNPETISRFAGM